MIFVVLVRDSETSGGVEVPSSVDIDVTTSSEATGGVEVIPSFEASGGVEASVSEVSSSEVISGIEVIPLSASDEVSTVTILGIMVV